MSLQKALRIAFAKHGHLPDLVAFNNLTKRRGKWGADFLFVHNDAGVTSVAITGESENRLKLSEIESSTRLAWRYRWGKGVGFADMVSVEEVKEKEYESNELQEADLRSGGDLEACEEQPELEVDQIVYDYF